MDYREQLCVLIDNKIEQLEQEINRNGTAEKIQLIKKLLELKTDLRKIIYMSDESINKISNIFKDDFNKLFDVLAYIKTIELGIAQGVEFVYSEEEIKVINEVFAAAEDKLIVFEEEDRKNRLREQKKINRKEKLVTMKAELLSKNEFFSYTLELITALKECGVSSEELIKIVVNLIEDNNEVYMAKTNQKKL